MRFAGKTVVVTGAGGFIGSHLVEALVSDGARVRAMLRYTSRGQRGALDLVPEGVLDSLDITLGDVRDFDAVRQLCTGADAVFHLAALIGIPEELSEAARVDGATAWGIFWRVKLPLLMPIIVVVSILTFVGNFNAFDLIYSVKGALAGPEFAADIMGTLFYRTFFGFQLQLGNPTMGATVAAMMFLIILTGVAILTFWQRRTQVYEL